MRKTLLVILLSISIINIKAEVKSTLSGYIRDSQSGEVLISATVYVEELKLGITSNQYGFYSLTIPDGDYSVQFRYVGFKTRIENISLEGHLKKDIELEPLVEELGEVTIRAGGNDRNVKSTEIKNDKNLLAEMLIKYVDF